MNMIRYFLFLDSFGVNMHFYLKGYKDYRSHLGGLITIIIYVVTIICAVIFSNEFIRKGSPKVSTASPIYKNPSKISYPDDIFFMFGITVNSIPFINEKIYRPIGHIRTKINGSQLFIQKQFIFRNL